MNYESQWLFGRWHEENAVALAAVSCAGKISKGIQGNQTQKISSLQK